MSDEICLNEAFAEDDSIEDVLNQEYAKGYNKGKADGIDECINSLGMVLDNENIKSELKHLFEKLKEQKNDVK